MVVRSNAAGPMQRDKAVTVQAASAELVSKTAKRLHAFLRKGHKYKDWTMAQSEGAVTYMVNDLVACKAASTETNTWSELQRRLLVLQTTEDARARKEARAGIRNIYAALSKEGGVLTALRPPADVLAVALLYFVGTRSVQLTGKWPFKTGSRK